MQRRAILLSIFIVFIFFPVTYLQAMPGSSDGAILEKKVASLQLGLGGYHIAHKLNAKQKEQAQKHLLEKSYPGTYTFTDEQIHILAKKKSDTILAIYLKKEKADKPQLKQMIADLMMQFGNPTSEAHDQIIYWAFNEKGKISEEKYNESKKDGDVEIIATVKFNSKLTFSDATAEEAPENSIHCIISSPELLADFYNKH